MTFYLETSDLRADVIENKSDVLSTLAHIKASDVEVATTFNVEIGSLATWLCECEMTFKFEDDAIDTDSEVPSTFADDASQTEASDVAEEDTTPNADTDSPASWLCERELAVRFADDVIENESEVLSTFANGASEGEASDLAKVSTNSLRVVIKRTFLHFELFDKDCGEIGLRRRISCRRLSDILHARDADAQAYKSAMDESMQQGCHDKEASPDAPVNYVGSAQHSDAESSADSSDIKHTWSNDCSTKGVISIGSVSHFQGLCRPCVWFWRPETCKEGVACKYCHLCDENALPQAVAAKRAIDKQKRKFNKAKGRK